MIAESSMRSNALLVLLTALGTAVCWWPAFVEPNIDLPFWAPLACGALCTVLSATLAPRSWLWLLLASGLGTFSVLAGVSGEVGWIADSSNAAGRLLQTNSITGMARNYSCNNYYTICEPSIYPSTMSLTFDQNSPFSGAWGWDLEHQGPSNSCSCRNPSSGSGSTFDEWNSANTSIATISSGSASTSSQWFGQGNGNTTGSFAVTGPYNLRCQVQAPVTVTTPPCFATLEYRPVTSGGIFPVGNHSYWWIQKLTAGKPENWILDGGPAGTAPNFGHLLDWATYGNNGHYTDDNNNQRIAWTSGSSPNLCTQVQSVFTYTLNWNQSQFVYALPGPNSNTFAHLAGNAAPFNPTAPPNAPGW